jgi:hypothetical protein
MFDVESFVTTWFHFSAVGEAFCRVTTVAAIEVGAMNVSGIGSFSFGYVQAVVVLDQPCRCWT